MPRAMKPVDCSVLLPPAAAACKVYMQAQQRHATAQPSSSTLGMVEFQLERRSLLGEQSSLGMYKAGRVAVISE